MSATLYTSANRIKLFDYAIQPDDEAWNALAEQFMPSRQIGKTGTSYSVVMTLTDIVKARRAYDCAVCKKPIKRIDIAQDMRTRIWELMFECHDQVETHSIEAPDAIASTGEARRWAEWLSEIEPFSGKQLKPIPQSDKAIRKAEEQRRSAMSLSQNAQMASLMKPSQSGRSSLEAVLGSMEMARRAEKRLQEERIKDEANAVTLNPGDTYFGEGAMNTYQIVVMNLDSRPVRITPKGAVLEPIGANITRTEVVRSAFAPGTILSAQIQSPGGEGQPARVIKSATLIVQTHGERVIEYED